MNIGGVANPAKVGISIVVVGRRRVRVWCRAARGIANRWAGSRPVAVGRWVRVVVTLWPHGVVATQSPHASCRRSM